MFLPVRAEVSGVPIAGIGSCLDLDGQRPTAMLNDNIDLEGRCCAREPHLRRWDLAATQCPQITQHKGLDMRLGHGPGTAEPQRKARIVPVKPRPLDLPLGAIDAVGSKADQLIRS